MRKILFLDIDGVLNSKHHQGDDVQDSFDKEYPTLNSFAKFHLQELNYICASVSNLEIVLSSDWRHHFSTQSIQHWMTNRGFKHASRIVDVTPHKFSSTRVHEIMFWLERQTEELSYAILDDINCSSVVEDDPRGCFCQTTEEFGLTKEIASFIVEFFHKGD